MDEKVIRVGHCDAPLHSFNAMAIARCGWQFDQQCMLLEETISIPAALVPCYNVRLSMLNEQTNNIVQAEIAKCETVQFLG